MIKGYTRELIGEIAEFSGTEVDEDRDGQKISDPQIIISGLLVPDLT